MDIDLLESRDEPQQQQQQQSIAPAVQPPQSDEVDAVDAVAVELSKLETGSNAGDEFGEFLHSDTSLQSETAGLTPPPASSLRPSTDGSSRALDTTGQSCRGADHGTEPSSESSDEAAVVSRLLNLISSAELLVAQSGSGVDGASASINQAWAGVEGLMGGINPHAHIGEMAVRLCRVIPLAEDKDQQEVQQVCRDFEPDLADDVFDTADTVCGSLRPSGVGFGQSLYSLVWPSAVDADCGEHEGEPDLVDAYLRLAETLQASPT